MKPKCLDCGGTIKTCKCPPNEILVRAVYPPPFPPLEKEPNVEGEKNDVPVLSGERDRTPHLRDMRDRTLFETYDDGEPEDLL